MRKLGSHLLISALAGLASVAACSAEPQRLAVLSATLPLSGALDAQGFGVAQLLPFGEFTARDGRPGKGKTWKLDNAQGRQIVASLNAIATRTPIVIDYEHQTLSAAEKGHKAPAAGWIHQVEWRDGEGAFARVKWTAAAKGHIDSDEYRFISPVIEYAEDGTVMGVLMGALVNYPALLGMEPVMAALSAFSTRQPSEPSMDRKALCKLLGLPEDATDVQINTAMAALAGELPQLRSQVTQLQARPVLTSALSAALGVAATADEAAALGAITTLRAAQTGTPQGTMEIITALQGQVAALTAQVSGGEVEALVDKAIAEKRFLPAIKDELLKMGKTNVSALRALVAAAPVIEGLSGQSGGQDRSGTQTAALAAQASEVARQFGLTTEQFQAAAPKA